MNRLTLIATLAFAACAPSPRPGDGRGGPDEPPAPTTTTGATTPLPDVAPHVLLIVIDDLGWTSLSSGLTSLGHASDYHQTPNLDALAQASLAFTHAYSSPNSTPTRASLMTGLGPNHTKLYTADLSNNAPEVNRLLDGAVTYYDLHTAHVTIAERMHDAGYRTGHFGKWDLGFAGGPEAPEAQGFDVNVGGDSAGFGGPRGGSDGHFATEDGGFDEMPNLPPNGVPYQFLADRLTDDALAFMAEDLTRPMFVHIAHYSAHTPVQAPAEDLAVFDAVPPGLQHHDPVFAGMLYNADRNVGRVLDWLEQTEDPRAPGHPLLETTLVILLSDNGGQGGYEPEGYFTDYAFANQIPLRSGKGSLYEGGIRVPLMIRFDPRGAGGRVSDEPVQHLDVAATILDATGTSTDTMALDGISLLPLLDPEPASLDRDLLFQHFPCYSSWRDSLLVPLRATPTTIVHRGEWKLWYLYETQTWALYDLATDLGETTNVADQHPDLVVELGTAMRDWLIATNADLPRFKGTATEVPLPDPLAP